MSIVRKSIFDHEKRILIKHSVLLCLLHMRLNITAKINQQSLSLSYSVCMQTSVLFQASSEWTDGTCSLKSHRWQLISVASGVKKKILDLDSWLSGATGETQFPQSTQVLRCQHHCFASVSEKDLHNSNFKHIDIPVGLNHYSIFMQRAKFLDSFFTDDDFSVAVRVDN